MECWQAVEQGLGVLPYAAITQGLQNEEEEDLT